MLFKQKSDGKSDEKSQIGLLDMATLQDSKGHHLQLSKNLTVIKNHKEMVCISCVNGVSCLILIHKDHFLRGIAGGLDVHHIELLDLMNLKLNIRMQVEMPTFESEIPA